MTSSFVPFAPAANSPARPVAATPSFARLVPAPASPSPVAEPPLPAVPEVSASATPPIPAHQPNCAPRIEVLREADRITRIQVHCSCGETIELDCQY